MEKSTTCRRPGCGGEALPGIYQSKKRYTVALESSFKKRMVDVRMLACRVNTS